MFRNMTMALIRHERIITTVAKAKEARPFIEKLITLAKRNDLHARRLVLARLGPPSKAEVKPDEDPEKADSTQVIVKLFKEIAPRFANRPGGYTRIVKRHQRRLGDAGETAILELLKEGETKKQKRSAPAPRAPEPAPAAPPASTPPAAESAPAVPETPATPQETPATPPEAPPS
jgi:large subunit ribosomal protein L17